MHFFVAVQCQCPVQIGIYLAQQRVEYHVLLYDRKKNTVVCWYGVDIDWDRFLKL